MSSPPPSFSDSNTYRVGLSVCNDDRKVREIVLEDIVDLGVLGEGGADHAGVSDV